MIDCSSDARNLGKSNKATLTLLNFLTFHRSKSTSFLRETDDSTKTVKQIDENFKNQNEQPILLRYQTQYTVEKSYKSNPNLGEIFRPEVCNRRPADHSSVRQAIWCGPGQHSDFFSSSIKSQSDGSR